MESRNLEKAMDIYGALIMGERVGAQDRPDLYEAYTAQAEVYDILQALLGRTNLSLYEYNNTLYVTPGYGNRIFGYTNEELKRAIGLRLNRELYLAYFIIYSVMTLFYEDTASQAAMTYVRTDQVIDQVTALFAGLLSKAGEGAPFAAEEDSIRSLALLWDELPLVTDNEDLSTLKAARGSRTGMVKLVFNFLTAQELFAELSGKYYITDRMHALILGYYDSCRGRLYELISEPSGPQEVEETYAAHQQNQGE